MATVGEAIAATLIAQWNVGTGGTQPDPIQYLVERPEKDPNPTVADAIYVWLPLRRTFDPIDVAEVYRNVTYTLRIVCHTKTSSARQLEIENEVDRILNSGTVITGATRQRVKEINDISNRSYSNLPKYISEVIMEVFTAMEVSATAYGTATTTTLTTDVLIVNTSITGDPTAALGATTTTSVTFDNQGAGADPILASNSALQKLSLTGKYDVTDVVTLDTVGDNISSTNIADLLMFGSANAAWINCPYEGSGEAGTEFGISTLGNIRNTGASSPAYLSFAVPLPPAKSGLKLYISGTEIGLLDADVNAYVDTTYLKGYAANIATNLDIDATNKNSPGAKQDTFTAVDCSPYDAVKVVLYCETDVAGELDIYYVTVRAYYAA